MLSSLFDDVIADYIWARAVLLTSPTTATVGLSLTIPLAIVTDLFSGMANGSKVTWISILGGLCVLIGFILVNVGLLPILKFFSSSVCGYYRYGLQIITGQEAYFHQTNNSINQQEHK
jgi:hypothetical protein